MKTKIIPFNLETAKKIQAGEIAGSIKTKNGLTCKIVSYCDGTDFFVERKTEAGYCRWCYPYTKEGRFIDGHNNGGTDYDLVLEVADSGPQFKPFDKVLVTQNGWHYWIPSLYRNATPDGKHICIDNLEYDKCLPYEGNEHLVATTDETKEG